MLIDPARRTVRIEGSMTAEQKASVANAMQPDLLSQRYAPAVMAGLTELERLAP